MSEVKFYLNLPKGKVLIEGDFPPSFLYFIGRLNPRTILFLDCSKDSHDLKMLASHFFDIAEIDLKEADLIKSCSGIVGANAYGISVDRLNSFIEKIKADVCIVLNASTSHLNLSAKYLFLQTDEPNKEMKKKVDAVMKGRREELASFGLMRHYVEQKAFEYTHVLKNLCSYPALVVRKILVESEKGTITLAPPKWKAMTKKGKPVGGIVICSLSCSREYEELHGKPREEDVFREDGIYLPVSKLNEEVFVTISNTMIPSDIGKSFWKAGRDYKATVIYDGGVEESILTCCEVKESEVSASARAFSERLSGYEKLVFERMRDEGLLKMKE